MSHTEEQILIVGAGIVGSALAHFLSASSTFPSSTSRKITVVDRSITSLLGSTGHAPGYVGQFNESEVLTKLAVDTVKEYKSIPGGFDQVGGLEVAFTHEGKEKLKSRLESALDRNLLAEVVSLERAAGLAPDLVGSSGEGEALYFPADGTANAGVITSYYVEQAKKSGVSFIQGDVKRLVVVDNCIAGVEVQGGDGIQEIKADTVVLTTGIWAQALCQGLEVEVPVVPVGHPYMHGRAREPRTSRSPFVRWPEHHVYARDHGTQYGIGSYNHAPVHHTSSNGTAIGSWIPGFDEPLKDAVDLLPAQAKEELVGGKAFNGIFSMTPDNMPLAGKFSSVEGLFCAVAVWVTHAAGTARFVTKILNGDAVEDSTREALDPDRFRGQDHAALEEKSLSGYNAIYKTVST